MVTRNAQNVSLIFGSGNLNAGILKVGAAAGAAVSMIAGLAIGAPLPSNGPAGTPATTGTDQSSIATKSASERLDLAAQLLADKQVVQARSMLLELNRSTTNLSERERARLVALLNNASKALKTLSPEDVSLQTAQDAMSRDELTLAERHAKAVMEAPKATNEQMAKARDVLASIKTRREAFDGQGLALVNKAAESFDAGRVEESKALLSRVNTLGLALDTATANKASEYKNKIVLREEAAMANGGASAAMMQPGVIKPIIDEPVPSTASSPAASEQPVSQAKSEPTPELVPVPGGGGSSPAPAVRPAGIPEIQEPVPAAAPTAAQVPAPAAATAPGESPGEAPAEAPAAAPMNNEPPAQPKAMDPITMARKLEAQSLLLSADKAFEEGRINEAVGQYDRVLREFASDMSQAEKTGAELRSAEARARLNAGGGNLIDSVINTRELQRQQVLAEYNNDLQRAKKALAEADTSNARNLVASANLRINAGRSVLSEPEFEGFSSDVRTLRAQIDTEENRISAEQARVREEELQKQSRIASQQAQSVKEQKISEAVDRVRALQVEMKYQEALQVTEQILFLDPINPTGLLLKDILTDMIVYSQYNSLREKSIKGTADLVIDNSEALIAPNSMIEYGSNWPRISQRGDNPAFSDSPEDRRVLATMQSRRIPVNFNETPLANVLDFIKAVTLLNVDTDWQSLEEVGINRETPVTLNLTNVTVETALSRVIERVSPDQFSGAAWSITDGVLTVASRDVINRNKALVIYDIRDLIVEVPDYINAPDFDLNTVLQQGGGEGGGQGQSPFTEDNADRERRTLEERTTEIIDIITTNIDPNGWQANGGDVGMIQQLGGNLIVTNTPANHRAIHGLLTKLRASRSVQINVETRFLLVSQDFFEQVGFDIDVYFNAKNNQVRAARGVDPNFLPSDLFDPALGNYTSNSVTTAATRGAGGIRPAIGAPTPTATQGFIPVARPSPLSVVGAPQNSLGLTEQLTTGGFATNILAASPALGVSGQFLDDIQVDFLVKATQADRRTVTLTAPRLTFTNGQTSNIYVATQEAFISDLTPVVADSAVGFDPEIGVVTEGVVMLVDGTVTADRRYVVLNVDTTVGTIDGFRLVNVTAVAGGQLVNSQQVNSGIEAPTITVTRVQTTVTVPDQGTILLGGQRLITESEVETGVPVLSKIPILNRFFTNRTESREEQTLLILLKPTILIQNEEEERAYPGLAESVRMSLPN